MTLFAFLAGGALAGGSSAFLRLLACDFLPLPRAGLASSFSSEPLVASLAPRVCLAPLPLTLGALAGTEGAGALGP